MLQEYSKSSTPTKFPLVVYTGTWQQHVKSLHKYLVYQKNVTAAQNKFVKYFLVCLQNCMLGLYFHNWYHIWNHISLFSYRACSQFSVFTFSRFWIEISFRLLHRDLGLWVNVGKLGNKHYCKSNKSSIRYFLNKCN